MTIKSPPGVTTSASPPFAPRDCFAHFSLECETVAPGDIRLRNVRAASAGAIDISARLMHWAKTTPEALMVGDETGNLTYGQAVDCAAYLAQEMLSRGLKRGDVVAVIAPAGRDHALLKLACLHAGLVQAPLSPALCASSSGLQKLEDMIQTASPKLVVAGHEIAEQLNGCLQTGAPCLRIDALLAAAHERENPAPDVSHAGSDAAAIYFTSGSTGAPKGVVITRGMISAVQAGIATHWTFLSEKPPVMVDWLPWHHVFGGLDNFFKMVWNGGAYHVGQAPNRSDMADIAQRIADIRPTVHVDVPFGIALLLDQFETRPHLLAGFVDRLDLIFFAGAGMDGDTWKRLNRLLDAGRKPDAAPLRLASGYGSTESGSTICLAHEQAASPSEIGIPLPGTELRLLETDGRTELRVRGPNISPGYIRQGILTPLPLDDQGYLRTGDTALPVRPEHPELGLMFDGRVAEDFKLTNGTRVKVGALRQMLLSACAPFLADVAIAGESREFLSLILFPTAETRAQDQERQCRIFGRALADHNSRWPASSMAVRRALIADTPPDPGQGEINDKGHLVQRRCLSNRSSAVKRLYEKTPDEAVIVMDQPDTFT